MNTGSGGHVLLKAWRLPLNIWNQAWETNSVWTCPCSEERSEVLWQFLFMVTVIHQDQQASSFPAPLPASPSI